MQNRIDVITARFVEPANGFGRRIFVKGFGGETYAKTVKYSCVDGRTLDSCVMDYCKRNGVVGTFHRIPAQHGFPSIYSRLNVNQFIHIG